jgi:hypothetical protein
MNLKLIVAILVIAAVPGWAQAQEPNAITNAEAQKVIEIISGDEAKTQTYCDIIKLGDQIEQAEQKEDNTDELYRQRDELAEKLGPGFVTLMNGLQDVDPNSEVGQANGAIMQATIETLNQSCGRRRVRD